MAIHAFTWAPRGSSRQATSTAFYCCKLNLALGLRLIEIVFTVRIPFSKCGHIKLQWTIRNLSAYVCSSYFVHSRIRLAFKLLPLSPLMAISQRAEALFFLLVRPLLLCKPNANRQVELLLLFHECPMLIYQRSPANSAEKMSDIQADIEIKEVFV